jgi:serine protease Do
MPIRNNSKRAADVKPRALLAAGLLACAISLGSVVAPGLALARTTPDGFSDLIDQVSPAVVQITSKQTVATASPLEGGNPALPEQFRDGPFKDFFERYFRDGMPQGTPNPQQKRGAQGSGFFIDDGIVVTNNHVVANSDEITVTLRDGQTLSAEVLGTDEKTDLAVLKVDKDIAIEAVKWGDSDATRVGDWVLAVGNPFGLGGTATAGIVSARGREIGAGPYDDFIQIDAPINSGNSGGPLFNRQGNVIGVNTAIYSPNGGNVGIGFAIPSDIAKKVVAEIRENGTVRRGWLGVRIQPVTPDIAESLGLEKAEGALVSSVEPNSPAEKAGLNQGDVILGFDNEEIADLRDLTRAVADAEIASKTKLTIWRGNERVSLNVRVGEAQQKVASNTQKAKDEVELGALGLTLVTLDDKARARFGLDDEADGVVVARVDTAKEAANKGLRPGDLITRVDQKPVSKPHDVIEGVERAMKSERKAVLLLVQRQGESHYVAVELADA